MSEEGATVEVEIGDTTYILQPKMSAMKAVNRMAGGYAGAFRRLNDFDMDAMATIIIAGTGSNGQIAKDILDAVYLADSEALQPKLVRFVSICAAGGRDPDLAKAGAAGNDGKN